MFCEPYLYVTSLVNLYLYVWHANTYYKRQLSGNNDPGTGRRPLTGFTFLSLFGLLDCVVMWLISMPIIKV